MEIAIADTGEGIASADLPHVSLDKMKPTITWSVPQVGTKEDSLWIVQIKRGLTSHPMIPIMRHPKCVQEENYVRTRKATEYIPYANALGYAPENEESGRALGNRGFHRAACREQVRRPVIC
jgi:hypothetical protein